MTILIQGAKAGQQQPKRPSIADDTIASISRLKMVIGLTEGEAKGLFNGAASIKLENTPLVDENANPNFEGVEWEIRHGTVDQTHIAGMPSASNEIGIGTTLFSGTPWVRSISDTQLSSINVNLSWAMLKSVTDKGDVEGTSIKYAIDVQTDGNGYVTLLNTSITAKTSGRYQRTHNIKLPDAQSNWQIRVRKITEDGNGETLFNAMQIDSIAEIIDAKLRYPHTALLYLSFDARTFSNIPKVSVHFQGLYVQVPTNYDPETRTSVGIWQGQFKLGYTTNPAWHYYNLITNDRYGLGDKLQPFMIDKWALEHIARICDEPVDDGKGGTEPRFECNLYLQKAEEAYQVLQHIAGIFRGMSFWNGSKIVVDADTPRDAEYVVTRANVINGKFSKSGSAGSDRHTIAQVAWSNPDNAYETEYAMVRNEKAIAQLGINTLDLSAVGCTSEGQAYRMGLAALLAEQNRTQTVSFAMGLDGSLPNVGSRIDIPDMMFAGVNNGGRISSVSDNRRVITIDRDNVPAVAGDKLIVNLESGKAQTRIITAINGRAITVALAFDPVAPENVWAVSSDELPTMSFIVMSVTEAEDGTQYNYTAMQYDASMYEQIDNGTLIEPRPPTPSLNPYIIQAPESIAVSSRHRVTQGQTIATLVITWDQVKDAVAYDVEWRKDDGDWIKLPRTGNISVDIDGVYSGNYLTRVRAVSAFDAISKPTTSKLTAIAGKVGKPPKLLSIKATGLLFGMRINWAFSTGSGDTAYTEIQVASAPDVNVATLGQFAYSTDTHTIQGLQGGLTQYYRGRIIDKLGNPSDWTAWTKGITDNSADKVLDLVQGKITGTSLDQALTSKIDKIAVNEIAISKETQDRINAINQSNAAIIAERNARTNAIQTSAIEQQNQLQATADGLVKDINTVTVAQSATDGQVATIKERQQTIINENGAQAEQLNYLSSEINLGYTDKTKYTDKNKATAWTFAKTVAHADYVNAESIRALSADYQNSSAKFTEQIKLNATKSESVAQQITTLSAQMTGGYSGSDLEQVTSGLIYQERRARATDVAGLSEQISLLSAGVGEQFDPYRIWHFDAGRDDWVNGTYAAGWLNVRTETVSSPVFSIDGRAYHHVKARVKQIKSPTWDGLISWTGGSAVIPSPTFVDGIAIIDIDLPWTGTITKFDLKLASSADNLNYYSIDWIAVGRPSPGASYAALLDEQRVRSSRDEAITQSVTALDSRLNTKVNQLSSSITQELQTLTTATDTTASAVNLLQSQVDNETNSLRTSINETNTTLTNELGAQAEQINVIKADYQPQYTDQTRYTDASRSTQWTFAKTVARDNYATNERITNLQSDVANSNAQITQSLNTLATKDEAIALSVEQLKTVTGDNKALIIAESSTRTDQFGSLSSQINTVQSSTATAQSKANKAESDAANAQTAATNAATLAGNKGEVIYQWQTPAAARQLPQNLWIDTTGGKNTPKRWDGSAWVVVTDKAAIDAQTAANIAQSTANEALGKANTATNNIATIKTDLTAVTSSSGATAKSVETLQTKVGNNTSSIETYAKTVDGLTAQWTMRLDVNGYVVGIGTYNDGKTGTFAIRTDEFYIGAPDGTKSLGFVHYTTSQTINGVVVPVGTYLRDAYIANGTITSAKIGNAAITTAKIANLAVKSAQIDNLAVTTGKIGLAQVDTLQIKGEAVIVPRVQFTATDFEFNSIDTEEVINSITINADGGAVSISFGFEKLSARIGNAGSNPAVTLRIKRGSTVLRTLRYEEDYSLKLSTNTNSSNQYLYSSGSGYVRATNITLPTILDTPPAGNQTYTITLESRGLNAGRGVNDTAYYPVVITARSLHIMGAKR